MASNSDILNWLRNNVNQYYDYDKYYGVQCMDLINQVTVDFFGVNITSHAMYPPEVWNGSLPSGWTKHLDSQPGDIFVMGESAIAPVGHIGFMADDNSHIYDQNGTSNNDGITLRQGWDGYYLGFIRPPYSSSSSTSAASKTIEKLGGKTNMILFQEGSKVYLWVGNKYTHIGDISELDSIKTMMAKAGYDIWIHTDAKQIKYIKKLAALA